MKLRVSIIIPTYKRKEYLFGLLRSLEKEIDSKMEIIIVEQGVNNGKEILSFAKQHHLAITYLFSSTMGTVHALNLGIAKTKGNIMVFFDDDCVIHKGCIARHLKNYTDSRVACVVGRIYTRGQSVEPTRRTVGTISFWGKFMGGYSSGIRQDIVAAIGCNMSVKKHEFSKIGGFDEQFTGPALRYESDVSLRLKHAGLRVLFDPTAVVTHLRAETGGTRKTEGRMRWFYHFFSNETYFFLKHRPVWAVPVILFTRWEYVVRCMFGFGREVSVRSLTVPFAGMADGVRKYKTFLQNI
jgi:GT2 family glycosyltransferase